ncbi:reverse transcriptase domain, reverse transcriptase zinc-binding domain protein [Tanacetum coccineum]
MHTSPSKRSNDTLSSMHIYWAFVFILPVHIIHDLEQLVRGFLWCQGELKKGKAKVNWESVCKPKLEGGLGIQRLEDFNVALMALTFRASSPIKNLYGLNRSIPISLRVEVFGMCLINNGKLMSMWFDKWQDLCHIRDLLTIRDITRSGFGLDDSVCDFISNGNWRWPPDWVDIVDWYHVVWFLQCIASHAFHLWLVTKEKLKTQDRLRQWDVGPSIDLNLLKCPLYNMVPDSHSHLFFECPFSMQVWFQVRGLADMDQIPPRFVDIGAYLIPISKGKSVVSVISRLLPGAVSYHFWMDRNSRLFKKKLSTVPHIVQVISSMVRLKLVSFKFKKASKKHLYLNPIRDSVFQSISGKGYKSFGQALFKSLKLMHILQLLSGFLMDKKMDKKMTTAAERQAENKRRFEEPSRNTQNKTTTIQKKQCGTGLHCWAWR